MLLTMRIPPPRAFGKISLASLLWLSGAAPVLAEPSWEKIKLAEHIDSVKFSGDLRLRHDASFKRGQGTTDRSRFRFRLRVGTEIKLPRALSVFFRLASGTGDQTGTNQSFDNLSSQKAIWIDNAYVRWEPKMRENGKAFLSGGRMAQPLWTIYSSDLIWDADVAPEGFGQGIEWSFPSAGLTLFTNTMQMAADEDSDTPKNQWVFSEQAGFETPLPLKTRLRMAAAYHKWSGENRSTLSPALAQDGNRRTAASTSGVLLNRFGVGELTTQLSGAVAKIPVALQATLARNLRARGDLPGPRAWDGYQAGVIVGKAAAENSWEAAYFKKYAETDAAVADVADSDFGDGGTNRKGHIFWAAYSPKEWLQVKFKGFVTETVHTRFAPGDKAVNRFQTDLSLKF